VAERTTPLTPVRPAVARRRRWNVLSAGAIVMVGAGLLLLALLPLATAPRDGRGGSLVGGHAPALGGPGLSGGSWSLNDADGRLAWVNFWATSCEPCRTEMPAMQRLAELYADEILVLGVNWGEDPAAVTDFVDRYAVRYPIVLDPRLENFTRWRHGVDGLPRHYFVAPDGTVLREVIGPLAPAEMLAILEELIGPPPA